MPARRRNRKAINKKRPSKKIYIFVLLALAFFAFLFFLRSGRRNWNGKDKIAVAIRNDSDGVDLVVFDPLVEEIFRLKVPGSTQIDVSNQLGIWRLESVWKLGEQEDLGGELLSRSITKSLKLPVYLWADRQALGLIEGGMTKRLSAVFSNYETNLSRGDRVALALFAMQVDNASFVEMDLSDTSFLEKKKLLDGEEGYVTTGSPPRKVAFAFSQPILEEDAARIRIRDATQTYKIAEEMGEALENLGGKVSAITRENGIGVACELRSKLKEVSVLVSSLYPCKVSEKPPEGNFDLEIYLGEDFVKIY